jgi:hypothetical protein
MDNRAICRVQGRQNSPMPFFQLPGSVIQLPRLASTWHSLSPTLERCGGRALRVVMCLQGCRTEARRSAEGAHRAAQAVSVVPILSWTKCIPRFRRAQGRIRQVPGKSRLALGPGYVSSRDDPVGLQPRSCCTLRRCISSKASSASMRALVALFARSTRARANSRCSAAHLYTVSVFTPRPVR